MDALVFYLFSGVILVAAVMVITARNPVHSVFFLILAFFNAAGLFILMRAEFLAMMLVVVYVGAIAVLFLFVVMMLDIKQPKVVQKSFSIKLWSCVLSFLWLMAYMLVAGFFVAALMLLIAFVVEQLTGLVVTFANPGALLAISVLCSLILGVGLAEFLFARVLQKSWGKIFHTFCHIMPLGVLVLSLLLIEILAVTVVWLRSSEFEEVLMAPTPPDMVLSNTHALGQIIYTNYIYVFQSVGLVLLVAMIGAIVLTIRRRPNVKRQDVSAQIYRRPEEAVMLKKVKSGQGIGDSC